MRGKVEKVLRRYSTASRWIASSAAVALVAAGAPAQDTTHVTPRADTLHDSTQAERDSALAERLRKAEEDIELLKRQLATQAAAEVHTASRVRFELFGRILLNTFVNTGRVNLVDDPQFVLPDTGSPPSGSVGLAIRQTTVGGAVHVARVLGGTLNADLTFDLFGAAQSNPGRTFPIVRLRTARVLIDWTHGQLLFGQETPVIMPLNPVSVAAVGTPAFVSAGNLWLWLPQIRLTGQTAGAVKVGLQAAVLAPTTGDPATNDVDPSDLAERSKRPFLQSRAFVRWGSGERDQAGGEVGVAGHLGWFATAGDSLLQSWAVAADARVRFTKWLELRAEGYRGQLLRGLGGGGISQNFGLPDASTGAPSVPLRDAGAWAQLIGRPTEVWELAGGCGIDDPNDADRPVRQRNVVCAGSVTARPGGGFLIGVEVRRLETTYAIGDATSTHANLALGFDF